MAQAAAEHTQSCDAALTLTLTPLHPLLHPLHRRWRKSSKFLEDGVMQNTAYRFYRQVQENTAAK